MGTALWLIPPPSTALQDVILSLSKAHSSPSFPPHITLASLPTCISLPEIVTCLSSEEQVRISFEQVRTGQTFFQSVFIAIEASPQLHQLHEHVHKTLGVQPKTPEYPHFSLFYGDEGKEEIVQKLKDDAILQNLEPKGVSVAGIREFLAMEAWVVNCVGRPEEWSVVEKVKLNVSASK